MRYFVTGATGFIGGRLARTLLGRGHQVVALARVPEAAASLKAAGAEIVKGDIVDKESMRAPMKGVDGVFHVAAWYKVGVDSKGEGERINAGGTRNVLELVRELSIPKAVYTSTVAVFSDTRGVLVDESYRHDGAFLSEYDRTKWLAHYEVALPMMKEGLPLVVVQPGVVYGPGDQSPIHDAVVQYLQQKLPVVPASATYCWCHVDDCVEGHILAMQKGTPGECYIIAGEPKRLVEMFELAAEVSGVAPPKLHAPAFLLRASAIFADLAGALVTLPPTYSAESLRASTATYIASNTKAARELGYKPRSLREGIREWIEYEMAAVDRK